MAKFIFGFGDGLLADEKASDVGACPIDKDFNMAFLLEPAHVTNEGHRNHAEF